MTQFSKQILFKNWSGTDFSWKYDNVEYTFEAGQTYNVPADIALHFALHLAKRERGDQPHHDAEMKKLMNNCFPGTTLEAVEKGQTTGTFEKVDILRNGNATVETPKVEENKTETSIQNKEEPEEEDVKDNKEPKFKSAPRGRPKGKVKDDEYSA